MDKALYAIIVNWNNYFDTKECINSLRLSSYPVTKIILVDNASTDGSAERLRETYLQDAKVYYIQNEMNLGFAGGVNKGIKHAIRQSADYVFIINNDAIVDKDCIKILYSAMKDDPCIAIAGPRIFYYHAPQRIWQGGGYFSKLKTGVVIPEKGKLQTESPLLVRQVSFLTGCAMLIKTKVFEKIGFFDEDFFFYAEDADFCLRAKRAGFKLLYVPSAKVWHKIKNISQERTTPFCMYHLARSRLVFLRKNFTLPYFLYGLILHLAFYTPYRIWQIVHGSRSFHSFKAWIQGTIDGIILRNSGGDPYE